MKHILRVAGISCSVLAVICAVATAHAYGGSGSGESWDQKLREKDASRWTVGEWVMGKAKECLFCRFFDTNGFKSHWENFLDFGMYKYTRTSGLAAPAMFSAYNTSIGIYFSMLGLRATYETANEDMSIYTVSANFRFYGRSQQDSHSNLEFGQRVMTRGALTGTPETFTNIYFGGSGDLYFTQGFGFTGAAYKIGTAYSNRGDPLDGYSARAMFFWDWGLLRLSLGARREFYRLDEPGGIPNIETRDAYGAQVRFFF